MTFRRKPGVWLIGASVALFGCASAVQKTAAPAAVPQIQLLSPEPGTEMETGKTLSIAWRITNAPAGAAVPAVRLMRPAEVPLILSVKAQPSGSDGTLAWTVAGDLKTDDDYELRIDLVSKDGAVLAGAARSLAIHRPGELTKIQIKRRSLILRLRSPDHKEIYTVINELGALGPRAKSVKWKIEKYVGDGSTGKSGPGGFESIGQAASRALQAIDPEALPKYIETLVQQANQPLPPENSGSALPQGPAVPLNALAGLERLGPSAQSAIPGLVPLLARPDISERAARTLNALGEPPPDILQAVAARMQDANPAVREGSIRYFSRLKVIGEPARSAIKKLTRDPDPAVRQAALRALEASTAAPVAPPLKKKTSALSAADRPACTREVYAQQGSIRCGPDSSTINEALATSCKYYFTANYSDFYCKNRIEKNAGQCWGKFNPGEAIKLQGTLTHGGEDRRWVVGGQCGSPVIETTAAEWKELERDLQSADRRTRLNACREFTAEPDRIRFSMFKSLALKEKEIDILKCALWALQASKDPGAAEVLLKVLQNLGTDEGPAGFYRKSDVSQTIWQLLGKLGTEKTAEAIAEELKRKHGIFWRDRGYATDIVSKFYKPAYKPLLLEILKAPRPDGPERSQHQQALQNIVSLLAHQGDAEDLALLEKEAPALRGYLKAFRSEDLQDYVTILRNRLRQPNPQEPPALFVDEGACPFECCTYGEWIAEHGIELMDAPDGKRVMGYIKGGEKVTAIGGEVWTVPYKLPGNTAGEPPTYLLTYQGEGYYRAFKGGKYMIEGVEASDAGVPLGKPESTWWIKIRTLQGTEGWTKDSNGFDGKDSCS
jgi:hypothetical protein